MSNPSNAIAISDVQGLVDEILTDIEKIVELIPAPGDAIVEAAIQAAKPYVYKGLNVVKSALWSRFQDPMNHAAPFIDAKYQDKVFELVKARRMGLVEDAIKDWTAWKVGPATELFGLDHMQKARTDIDVQKIFVDSGMPHWMACTAAAVFARTNGEVISARHWDDEACDVLGIPRTHIEADIYKVGMSRWNGQDETVNYKGSNLGNEKPTGGATTNLPEYDKEWANAPLDFNPADLSGAGDLTPAGLEFLKIAVTAGIDGGTYPSEGQIFYDWTIRPKNSDLKWWHSFAHWMWTNGSKFKDEQDKKNLAYFAEQDAAKEARAQKERLDRAKVGAIKPGPNVALWVLGGVVVVVAGVALLGGD